MTSALAAVSSTARPSLIRMALMGSTETTAFVDAAPT
jgi:hypothetical protein